MDVVHETLEYDVISLSLSLRVLNISSGKQKRSYKGSERDEGHVLKVYFSKTRLSDLHVVDMYSCKSNNREFSCRLRWIRLVCMWPSAVLIRPSVSLTSGQESV